MPSVFKSKEDEPALTEIMGVGVLGPNGKGGVAVSAAAETMTELQDENGEPLTGARLTSAAKAFADARGFEIVNISESKIAGLRNELGSPPDPIDVREASIAEYDRLYGPVDTANDPDAQAQADARTVVDDKEEK